mgnify:CR=1
MLRRIVYLIVSLKDGMFVEKILNGKVYTTDISSKALRFSNKEDAVKFLREYLTLKDFRIVTVETFKR